MENRQLHAIQIKLRALEWIGVIIWPFRSDDGERCCRLINSKRTWLTARADDAVLLRRHKSTEWQRFYIESVSLYRAFPVEFNGVEVANAQGWLSGDN